MLPAFQSTQTTISIQITFSGSSGGESGIRTHGRNDPSPVFKTGALNRSAISPDVPRRTGPGAYSRMVGWVCQRPSPPSRPAFQASTANAPSPLTWIFSLARSHAQRQSGRQASSCGGRCSAGKSLRTRTADSRPRRGETRRGRCPAAATIPAARLPVRRCARNLRVVLSCSTWDANGGHS